MARIALTVFSLFFTLASYAQYFIPYEEAANPKAANTAEWTKIKRGAYARFGSTERYKKEQVPTYKLSDTWTTKAWRGEKIHTQVLFWSTQTTNRLTIQIHPLKNSKGQSIPSQHIKASFVRYVLTDSLSPKGENCNIKPGGDSSLVADVIDEASFLSVKKNTTQPIWLSIRVPQEAVPGFYSGFISLHADKKEVAKLPYKVEVQNHTLPIPEDFSFHLDLWQNPYSISRVHEQEDWSNAHFDTMRNYFTLLKDAGQKVITASIIYDPWNSQTLDVYNSMVKWIKKENGTWEYDYTNFDKWVNYMMSLGIDKQINCYSMIPWNLKFYYYDEALQKDTFMIAKPEEKEYGQHWEPMLKDFAQHLKTKGWFEKTMIAMDERAMKDMQAALQIIKNADKDWKVSLAGNFHPEIEKDLADYCVALQFVLSDTLLAERREKGFVTTYYTACPESHPNMFSFSSPAESAFLGWYAAANDFDGYLRWAYNSWPKDPLRDSRFGNWPGGDTYLVYPGARSSVRLEMLTEGIQAFEKIKILQKEFSAAGNTQGLSKIKDILSHFKTENLQTQTAESIVSSAQDQLQNL